MPKLLILNWKMNPQTLNEALSLARASDYENVVITPPFVFIEEAGKFLKNAQLGAQDLFWKNIGSFTGEISAGELKNLGVRYVLVGHSERRHKLGETDEIVAKKMKAAADSGLIPILCIGETKEERDAGKRETVLERQLQTALTNLRPTTYGLRPIIAYEPAWAIGTGNPETPESALETIKFIKNFLQTTNYKLQTEVLYGGSINSKNLKDYIKYEEIDGALVGGASLKPSEVEKMIIAVNS